MTMGGSPLNSEQRGLEFQAHPSIRFRLFHRIDSTRAMQPFELPEHHESHTDEPEQ